MPHECQERQGGKTDKECFRCGRIGHVVDDCRAKTHVNGGLKALEIVSKKGKKHRNVDH